MSRTMPLAMITLMLAALPALAGPVQVGEGGGTLTLRNGLVAYDFDGEAGYTLAGVRPDGVEQSLLVRSSGLTFTAYGAWMSEADGGGFGAVEHSVEGDGATRTLHVTSQSDALRIDKRYTLAADDPALRIEYRVEVIGPHAITWGYVPLVWLDERPRTWLRPENVVRGGEVVEGVAVGLPGGLTVGNRPVSIMPESWVACLDPALGQGIAVMTPPGEGLPLRAGEQGERGFVGLRFSSFPSFDPNAQPPASLSGALVLCPFAGEAGPAIEAAVARHGKPAGGPRFPAKAESGGRLPASGISLWWDLPTSKVFPDEPAPEAEDEAVELQAAFNEYEPFQLVVRADRELRDVRLECGDLVSAEDERIRVPVAWNALEYYHTAEALDPTGWVGETPDTLLPAGPVDLAAGRNQLFWLTVRTPRLADGPPGEYRGTVRVLAGDEQLAEVPVTLTIWSFELPETRQVDAFAPAWRSTLRAHYGEERTAELWPSYLDLLADHRLAMLHPEANPRVTWAEDGSLAAIDFAAFDAAVNDYFRRFRLDTLVLADFTIGYGHIPRKHRFGEAEEILTEPWRARVTAYARALSAHLQERGWDERVVFSLFDEPDAQYYPLVRGVVELLRDVDPAWRFTYWGAYAPQLEGAVDVWTIPMSHYTPALHEQVRARGETVWVYNPPGYEIDATAMAVRANWWWLFNERVPAIYQWTTTAWIEWTGSTTLWDPHRNASWIIPGEDGPLSTVRMELTREGIEDIAYLHTLAQIAATGEASRRDAVAAEARGLLDAARAIAWAPRDGKAPILHTQDQNALHDLRQRIGRAIPRLSMQLM